MFVMQVTTFDCKVPVIQCGCLVVNTMCALFCIQAYPSDFLKPNLAPPLEEISIYS